ncbi:MAG: glycosyltransferase family 2 protein [Actinomycetota bacterium]|nr:glycosyltransferase family 2 protein [Actinomycetota bacterium]
MGSPLVPATDRAETAALSSTGAEARRPLVSVGVPTLNEDRHISACLDAIVAQGYPGLLEVLVADGGSTDRTREIVLGYGDDRIRLLDNPRRIRPAGLNVAIGAATGEVFVRVDARTKIAPDYVERCVGALERTNAAIVGGPMRYCASNARERGISKAMTSRLGAGPAAFRREGGGGRFVDTVYLGAYRLDKVRALGGYDELFGGNEDAELAYRAQSVGGVYLDPAIVSTYAVREGYRPLWRQFRRYGTNRAVTIRKHPRSLSARQLAVPALVAGLASPWRRPVAVAYLAVVAGRALLEAVQEGPTEAMIMAGALPTMHGAWAAGFFEGIVRGVNHPDPASPMAS